MIRKFIFTANTLLFCALFLAACAGSRSAVKEGEGDAIDEAAYTGDDDMWNDIEFVSQLEGDWDGSSVISVPIDRSRGLPETVFYADLSLSYMGLNVVQRIKVSFYAFLVDMLSVYTDSGFTIDDLWEHLFEKVYAEYPTIKEEYALIIENSMSVENLFNNEENELYISQDETRLRWLIQNGQLNGLLEPFGVTEYVEFILEKR